MSQAHEAGTQRDTPLRDCHIALKAKMVPFAGFSMPVQYSSVLEEHRATRSAAGLFDVSHMGEFEVRGPEAGRFLDHVVPSRASTLPIGKVVYSVLTTERGTIVDDLLIYRMAEDHFMTVVNASNRAKDFAWMQDNISGFDASLGDVSDATALIALQGPKAREIMARLATGVDAMAVKYYHWARGLVAGRPMMASRTGYTGEMGFEIFLSNSDAPHVWTELMSEGAPFGIRACGLAARDTLRLEAGLPLYGNDIDDTTTVLEAALDFTIDWSKESFVGRAALEREQESGPLRRRVGFRIEGVGIPRQHNAVMVDGSPVGEVTSGSFSPTLELGLGMAYVPRARAVDGARVEIDVRGRRLPGALVPLPFYRRPSQPKV